MNWSRPSPRLQALQAQWLAPARGRLLRQVAVARRRRILDLGAGDGAVTIELVRRSGGSVVALDQQPGADVPGAERVVAPAQHMPFAPASFDLVFTQCALMWMPLEEVLDEVVRVLAPGGALAALEPDYGGMIEAPEEVSLKDLWVQALSRAGADPFVGRRLPASLAARGLDVRVGLLSQMQPPHPTRMDLLDGLPLEAAERLRLERARTAAAAKLGPWSQVAHLPFLLVAGVKPGSGPT